MSVGDHGGKGYAPLPQSMSNTDTENDDDDMGIRGSGYISHNVNNSHSKHESDAIRENGRFYPLDETKNVANRMRNGRGNVNLALGYCSDDIPIMVVDEGNDDLWKRRHMSFIRQFFLAASILLCLATILIFLYVIPCDESDSDGLPLSKESRPAFLWENDFQGIELYGPISLVSGKRYNVISMYRRQLYGEDTKGDKTQSEMGGVISFVGGTELPLWWVKLSRLPTEIDCGSHSTAKTGSADCLVVGEKGLLISIEQITGTVQWRSNVTTHSKLPAFLPDVNNDGVNDLLSVDLTGGIPGLVLISGKNGDLVGQRKRPDCSGIDVRGVDSTSISFYCDSSDGKGSLKSMSLAELFDPKDVSEVLQRLATKISSPVLIPEVNLDDMSFGLTPFHQLAIQRQTPCPGELCQTSIRVTFQRDGSQNDSLSIWTSFGSNSYGMRPAILRGDSRSLVTGFVMKFWQWNWPDGQLEVVNSSLVRRTITERILVVIINQTEVHAVNASQTDISQICKSNYSDCQPSLELQSESLFVADLNNDGFRELISYHTSYDLEGPVKSLKSKIQAIRLDLEVAKLTAQT